MNYGATIIYGMNEHWIVYITHNWSVGITIYRKVPSKCPWALAAQAPQKLGVGSYTENLLERLNHLLVSAHPRPSYLQVEARNRWRALHCSGDIQHAWPLCSRHTEGYTDNRACFCWDLQSLLVFSETCGYKYRVSTDRLFFLNWNNFIQKGYTEVIVVLPNRKTLKIQ